MTNLWNSTESNDKHNKINEKQMNFNENQQKYMKINEKHLNLNEIYERRKLVAVL